MIFLLREWDNHNDGDILSEFLWNPVKEFSIFPTFYHCYNIEKQIQINKSNCHSILVFIHLQIRLPRSKFSFHKMSWHKTCCWWYNCSVPENTAGQEKHRRQHRTDPPNSALLLSLQPRAKEQQAEDVFFFLLLGRIWRTTHHALLWECWSRRNSWQTQICDARVPPAEWPTFLWANKHIWSELPPGP